MSKSSCFTTSNTFVKVLLLLFWCFNGLNIFLTKSILYSRKIVIFLDKCNLPLAFQVELNCTKIPGIERPSAPQLVQINGQQAVGHPPGLERQPKGVCLFTGAHLYHWHLKGWSLTSLFINWANFKLITLTIGAVVKNTAISKSAVL